MPARTKPSNGADSLSGLTVPTNDAKDLFEALAPYTVEVALEGASPIIFHRWSDEEVAAKNASAKGSSTRKTDNLESFVWRVNPENLKSHIGIPGEYLRMTIVNAAKFRQDPRSPRKSAMDLYKAAIISLTDVASLGKNTWDGIDKRRVTVQRAGVTRSRPFFNAGWKATFQLMCNLPEYISPQDLLEVIGQGGRVVGLADFRPTYGRYNVVNYKIL